MVVYRVCDQRMRVAARRQRRLDANSPIICCRHVRIKRTVARWGLCTLRNCTASTINPQQKRCVYLKNVPYHSHIVFAGVLHRHTTAAGAKGRPVVGLQIKPKGR